MLALRQIHLGDCRQLLAQLPEASVNCVVTSPPYWGLRDYGIPPSVWGGDPAHEHAWGAPQTKTAGGGQPGEKRRWQHAGAGVSGHPEAAAGQHCECGAWLGCLGLEPTPYLFVDHMVEVFQAVRRVLRSDGTLWLNIGDSYCASARGSAGDSTTLDSNCHTEICGAPINKRGYRGDRLANGRGDSPAVLRRKTRADRDGSHAGKHTGMTAMGPVIQPNRMPIEGFKPKDRLMIPARIAIALQADGWWLRDEIVWHKPNPMPESVTDRTTKAHEMLYLFSKSGRYYYDAAAIREPQIAPESSTPDDAARAFSRRRATTIEPQQQALTADAVVERRRTSGNRARKQRKDYGGAPNTRTNQAHSVPWTDQDGMRNKRSVWTVPTQPYSGAHFATFPPKLVEPCIMAGAPAGGVVLDPFGGSGTVGQVAEALGRSWIAFDLNPDYVALAEKRTAQRGLFVEPASVVGGTSP